MRVLDHIVLAAADLDQAKEDFADATGCMPADGGPHTGAGTRNALVSLGAQTYLEIISPDPDQSLNGTLGAVLAELPEPTLLHWAVRTDALERVASRAAELGFTAGAPRAMSRLQPGGARLDWQVMGLGGHSLGGFAPFYIDWLRCIHPATTSPLVGELARFEIRHTDPALVELLTGIDGVQVAAGEPRLHLQFQTARGPIEYDTPHLRGFFA